MTDINLTENDKPTVLDCEQRTTHIECFANVAATTTGNTNAPDMLA